MSEFTDEMGPIDYLIVEYPGSKITGEALPALVDLVERGIIRVLDLTFLRRLPDGSAAEVELKELQAHPLLADLALFEGCRSGLLTQQDLDAAAEALEPASAAAVLVYENVWAAPFAMALRRAGARPVASGRIPVQALLGALDELDEELEASHTVLSDR